MADKETQGEFADILAIAQPELRPLCSALRTLINSLHPDVTEVVWPRQKIASYGFGPKKMTDHYAYIAVQSSHINLGFYNGAVLPDGDGLLAGAGKRLRHVKLNKTSDSERPAVIKLLKDAHGELKRRTSHAGANSNGRLQTFTR